MTATHHGPHIDDIREAKGRNLWAEFTPIKGKNTIMMRITGAGIRLGDFVRGIDKDGKRVCFLIDNIKKTQYELITIE